MTKKKILSLILACMFIIIAAAGCGKKNSTGDETTQAGETSVESTEDGNSQNTEKPDKSTGKNINGTILQCFAWSFNTISESMEDIAHAGYAAIQTSPANECIVGGNGGMELMGQGKWYYHYQPTDWKIGNYQLGTKEEFKAMCEKAHSYGIKVIVDVVPNHTAGDESAVSQDLINAVGGIDKLYHSTGKKDITDYADRAQCTLYSQGGLYDVNTENKAFQDYFIGYLNECIACGADGFRYDTAKHIGLEDDPKDTGVTENNFWKRVISEIDNADNIFNYGEVLQGDNERIADYIDTIGAATASSYGYKLRTAIKSAKMDAGNLKDYAVGSRDASTVTWVESHDTYTGEESTSLTDEDIKLGWAFLAARENGNALFFARPYGSSADNMWGTMNRIGVAGSYLYKDATVAAANLFNKAVTGESEKLSNPDNDTTVIMVERGNKGLVVVNSDSSDKQINCEVSLADGKYVNRADNSTEYTVDGGKITGTIPARSAIILCNDGYEEYGTLPEVKIEDGTSCIFYEDSIQVTLKASNADSAAYSLNGGAETAYTDGDKIEIKAGSDNTATLRLTAKSGNNQTVMTYVFTHKKTNSSGTKIYFQKPAAWADTVNAYVYDESSSEVKENAAWPGVAMTDEGNGLYSYVLENDWSAALVIFNDGSNQYPGTMEPGFTIENDKTYTEE